MFSLFEINEIKGVVIFSTGYPLGANFKGSEIFQGKFKGSEKKLRNFKGSENLFSALI